MCLLHCAALQLCWFSESRLKPRSVMGLTKQYLRYVSSGNFNIIASTGCNIVFVTLQGQEGRFVAVGACEDVIVWDLRLGEKALVLAGEKHEASVLCSSPDKHHLAAGYTDGIVRVFDLKSTLENNATSFSGHKAAVTCLAYDGGGHRLASGSKDTDIIIWDVVAESGLHRLKGHKNMVTQLSFLLECNMLLSSSKDAVVKMWDLDTVHCFRTLVGHVSEVWGLVVMKSDKYLLTGSMDSFLKVWRMNIKDKSASHDQTVDVEDNVAHAVPVDCSEVGSLLRSGRGRLVSLVRDATAQVAVCHGVDDAVEVFYFCPDQQVQVRMKRRLQKLRKKVKAGRVGADVEQDDTPASQPVLKDEVHRVCVIKAGGKVKSAAVVMGRSNELRVALTLAGNAIELHTVKGLDKNCETSCLRKITSQGHTSDVRAVAFSSDNLAIVTASAEAIKVWNRPSLVCLRTVATGYVLCVCFVPGDRHVLAGMKDGRLLIVDIAVGDILEEIPAHSKELWSVCLMPDQRGCVTGGGDATVKIWQFELVPDTQRSDGKVKVLSALHTRTLKLDECVLSVCVSADGRLLAAALLDSTVKIFFVDTLKFFLSLYGHKLPVLCLDMSGDSTIIATGSADRTIKLWGLDFGDCHRSIIAHDDSVTGVKFVPGTHQLFTCGKDGPVKHWDADSFNKILTIQGHRGEAWCMAVSPSGQYVVSSGSDRVSRLYERSQEPLVLEDEQQEERAREETTLATGEGLDRNLPSKKTVGSEQAAEQLLECLEVCRDYAALLDEHNKSGKGKTSIPPVPPLMAAYKVTTPDQFLLEMLSRIRTNDLEEALLLLPFPAVCQLLQALPALFQRSDQTEQLARVLVFLLRVHHGPIVTNPSLLPVVEQLRSVAITAVQRLRDVVGLNLHALGYVQRQVEAHEGIQLFRDATQHRKKKEKRHRSKEMARKRALMLL